MKHILILLTVLLVSCGDGSSNKKGADGYYFEKETFKRTKFEIELILLNSPAEVSAEVKKRIQQVAGSVETKNVAAFSIIRDSDTKCTIYTVDPKIVYEPEWLGHELTHCIYGVWHREPQ